MPSTANKHMAIAGILTAIAVVGAWGTGALRPADATLTEIALDEVETCMAEDGQEYPVEGVELEALDRRDPTALSYDACLIAVVQDDRFADLGLQPPSEQYAQLTADGYAWWDCVQDAGYRLTTGVPLSSEGGYPLAVRAGHFEVGPTDADLRNFYQTAANCGDRSLESMRDLDGTFSRDLSDGSECTTHEHNGDRHSHGCYWADEGA